MGGACGRCRERRHCQGCECRAKDHRGVGLPRGRALLWVGFAFCPLLLLSGTRVVAAGWGQPQPCPMLVPSRALQRNPAQPMSHPLPPRATGWFVQGAFSPSTGTFGDKECFCQLGAERVGVWEEEDVSGEDIGFGVPGESPPVPFPTEATGALASHWQPGVGFLRMLESWGKLSRRTSRGGSTGGSKRAGCSLKIFVEMAGKGDCQQN